MSKSSQITTQIAGRFSNVFEVKTEKDKYYYVNFYFLGGRFRIQAPKFEIVPGTDCLVTLELSHTTYKDTKGYEKSVLRPVAVLSVEPL